MPWLTIATCRYVNKHIQAQAPCMRRVDLRFPWNAATNPKEKKKPGPILSMGPDPQYCKSQTCRDRTIVSRGEDPMMYPAVMEPLIRSNVGHLQTFVRRAPTTTTDGSDETLLVSPWERKIM